MGNIRNPRGVRSRSQPIVVASSSLTLGLRANQPLAGVKLLEVSTVRARRAYKWRSVRARKAPPVSCIVNQSALVWT